MLTKEEIKEFTELLSQDLENGNTDKVVELFRYNTALYETLGKLLTGGSMFVRLGVNILMEELKEKKPEDMQYAFPALIPLLKNENPTIRGDVADIIGMIGDRHHIDLLQPLLKDEHTQVQDVVAEAIENLEQTHR